MWILGSLSREASFLYLPGLLGISIAMLFPDLGEVSLVFGLFATGFIDSGHVYTTAWRTYLHPEEWKTNKAYLFFPALFFCTFFAWFLFRLPYLWSFVVYATLYHHVRQVYGISKWYQKLNLRSDRVSDFFLYVFACLPIVIYHFRPDAISGYYTSNDLLLFPAPGIHGPLLTLYFLILSLWLVRERLLWRKGIREVNRLLSVGVPAAIYGYCFLVGETITQILFPLLFLHGWTYFGVMELSLTRTQNRFRKAYFALGAVLITALVMGLGEAWYEDSVVDMSLEISPYLNSMIIALWLTPLFCHYAFDAIIWRKGHREAAVVFRKSET